MVPLLNCAWLLRLRGARVADRNKDDFVQMSELGEYVKNRVSDLTNNKRTPQHPPRESRKRLHRGKDELRNIKCPLLMPSVKSKKIKQIIKCLEVGRHTIEVKPKHWQRFLKREDVSNAITTTGGTYTISREQLLRMPNKHAEAKCLAILMWGYPNGGRGRNVRKVRSKFKSLAAAASQTQLTWLAYYESVNRIEGVGISIITKLAYFFGHKFDGYKAVILDDQIAKTLNGKQWTNAPDPVGERNAWTKNYLTYLEQIDDVGKSLGAKPDQVELFLYLLGPHFR